MLSLNIVITAYIKGYTDTLFTSLHLLRVTSNGKLKLSAQQIANKNTHRITNSATRPFTSMLVIWGKKPSMI